MITEVIALLLPTIKINYLLCVYYYLVINFVLLDKICIVILLIWI